MRKLKLQELGRASLEEFKSQVKTPIVVVLDNIRSAMNVGSFFRTADAFKIEKLILCGITATPPHKEILKTAIGATESINWEYEEDIALAISKLRDQNFKIIGIEQTDESIPLKNNKVQNEEKYAILFGNEVHGLSDSILPFLDVALEIEQYGTKHSLNVSVCAGIVLWQFSRFYL